VIAIRRYGTAETDNGNIVINEGEVLSTSPSLDERGNDTMKKQAYVKPPVFAYDAKTAKLAAVEFDFRALRECCIREPEQIAKKYGMVQHGSGRNGKYWLRKTEGAKILLVAHTDTVCAERFAAQCSVTHNVYSPSLDNRMGVYTACELLPRLGIVADILLTEGEETGQSTALLYAEDILCDNVPVTYNWVAQFDRMGEDVVTYQYDSEDWLYALTGSFDVGSGSYSDIAELGALGVSCVNVGVGYRDYHSTGSHILMREYLRNIARFVSFYSTWSDTRFAHAEREESYFSGYDYATNEEYGHCIFCSMALTEYEKAGETGLCSYCRYDKFKYDDDHR